MAVGPRTLRSLLVLDLQPPLAGSIAVDGGGLGHGVGLCQWGARGMALQNRSAQEILAQYFPKRKSMISTDESLAAAYDYALPQELIAQSPAPVATPAG